MNQLKNQHGDVLLFKIDAIPANVKKVESKDRVIVMSGEVTNHHHAIADTAVAELFMDDSGTKFLNVKEDTVISHEEHCAQPIEAGLYRVGQIQEYDYDELQARAVRD